MASHSPSSPDPSVTRLLSESADLRRTIHGLELQLRDSRETAKTLSTQVQGFKARAEEADSQPRLSQTSVNLEETLRRRDSEVERLAEKCSRLEIELEQSEKDLKACRKDLHSSRFALSAAQNELLDVKTTLVRLEEDRGNYIKQIQNAQKTEIHLENAVSDLNSEVQSLQSKVQSLGEEKVRLVQLVQLVQLEKQEKQEKLDLLVIWVLQVQLVH